MSSNQTPFNFQGHSNTSFESTGGDATISSHNDPLEIGHFLMDNGQTENVPHIQQTPQLDLINNPQFADFSFPYQHGMQAGQKSDNTPEAYQQAGTQLDHHNSVPPLHMPHRSSFSSSIVVAQARNASVSGGSEDASPTTNRLNGSSDGGYKHDFGMNSGTPVDGSDLGGRSKEEKSDPAPPWSELKTKAGKERKRLPLACIACRRKKIRCSGEKPACKHCVRSRIPCTYKVTTRKAAPRTDYMAMLDKRLKRMEERIIKIVPKEEQDNTASVTRANVRPALPGTVSSRNPSGQKRGADEAFGAELDSWSKSSSHAKIDSTSKSSSTLVTQEAEESKLLSEGAEFLPPRDIQEHLSEVFFENVYGQAYHVLHKPSFMRKLKAGTLPPVLVLAVAAVSARFSTHPKLSTTPAFLRGENWAAAARDIVIRRYDWPNITILTCLLIMGLHEFGTCQGGRSWSFGGQAIRMAYALQLHTDVEHDPHNKSTPLSFIDREIRRRTMWACFLMDRFNSSGTERPTFMKEENMKIPLPIKEKYFQLDMPGPTEDLWGGVPHPVTPGAGELSNPKENMGVAAYMIRALALWGRIINYLNLGGKEADPHPMWHPNSVYASLIQQAEAFAATLPQSLKYTPDNLHTHETEGLANQFLFLHISIQQNILFLNRFAVPINSKDDPKEFVTTAGANAFEAANRISELLRDGESYFVTAPFTGYCAFLSSTVHVFGAFSNNESMEKVSKKNLATNIVYLAKMKRYWGMFHFMSENLKEQYKAYAEAAKNGSKPQAQIFQYGDWFEKYPHGVSQFDFEDPAVHIKNEKGDDAVLEQKSDLHTVEEFFHNMTPPQHHEMSKAPKRKKQKTPSARQERLDPVDTNIQNQQVPMQNSNHLGPQSFDQMSPTTPVNMFHQSPYYNQDTLLPPHQQGILPQLDRQLVYGAYAGMDPPAVNSQNIVDNTNWDVPMNAPGFVTESSSAWFMPFNMQPPEIGHEADIFNTMGDIDPYSGIPNMMGMGGN